MRAHPAGKLGEGATAVTGAELCERLFQSTPLRGGGDKAWWYFRHIADISIHAPREGGDVHGGHHRQRFQISIHAPREGGDGEAQLPGNVGYDFNPRPPRGGRRIPDTEQSASLDFNPRPPRGGRRRSSASTWPKRYFNPRPPRGGRQVSLIWDNRDFKFQSTPPARGATSFPEV